MDALSKMKSCFCFLLVAGCAQPASLHPTSGGTTGGRRDGGLVFDDGGSPQYSRPDLAGAPVPDLAQPPSLPDLAAAPDLAMAPGADLAVRPGVDLAKPCATVENCFNDLDDDCDGTINNGCPSTLGVGADVPLVAEGGSGGTATSAHCPAGQVASGVRFIADSFDFEMAGIGVACSTLTLVRGASSYSVTLSTPTALAAQFAGSSADSSADGACDTTQFQVAWNSLMNTDTYVNGLGMDCALGTLSLSPANQLSISFSNLNNHFGINYGGGTEHPQACGSNQAIVGYNGRTGGWLDQIQPICAPIVVNYIP
jgi:hypothetical protein